MAIYTRLVESTTSQFFPNLTEPLLIPKPLFHLIIFIVHIIFHHYTYIYIIINKYIRIFSFTCVKRLFKIGVFYLFLAFFGVLHGVKQFYTV